MGSHRTNRTNGSVFFLDERLKISVRKLFCIFSIANRTIQKDFKDVRGIRWKKNKVQFQKMDHKMNF